MDDDLFQVLIVSSIVAPFVSQVVTRNIYKTHYQLAIFVLCSQPELIPVFLSSWAITQCSIVLRHALDEVLNLLSGFASVMGCNVRT